MTSLIDKTGILLDGGGGLLFEATKVPNGGTSDASNRGVVGINSVL